MEKIQVNLFEKSYAIYTGVSLDKIGAHLAERGFPKNILIITNTTVGELYGERVAGNLAGSGFMPATAIIPDGEKYKTLDTVKKLYQACITAGLDRRSLVISLGGGVVGDIAGFTAATFKRGVPVIHIPTTLLSMVDSSVGGKTGVNLAESKNLIGAFYQPKMVFIDISALKTLKKREFVSGLAEVIKYGVIKDGGFFENVEKNINKIKALDKKSIENVIKTSCTIKKKIVEIDEKESGLRAVLNFGHTIGHALESATGYKKYLHGEAVSVGMACASRISARMGLFGAGDVSRIDNLLIKAGLPVTHGLGVEKILDRLVYDKKSVNGKINFILPYKKIGRVVIKDDVPGQIIKNALSEVKK